MHCLRIQLIDRGLNQFAVLTKLVRVEPVCFRRGEPLASRARSGTGLTAANSGAQSILSEISARHHVLLDQPGAKRDCECKKQSGQHQTIDTLARITPGNSVVSSREPCASDE